MPSGSNRRTRRSTGLSELDTRELYERLLAERDTDVDTGGPLEGLIGGALNLVPGVGPIASNLFSGREDVKTVVEEGEDAPVLGPGIGAVKRLFDVLSRGNYASAAAASQAPSFGPSFQKEDDSSIINQLFGAREAGQRAIMAPLAAGTQALDILFPGPDVGGGNPLGEAARGIAGTNKRTYAQNLEESGVTNPALQGTLGFAMDVALDPTTYSGSFISKGRSAFPRELLEHIDDVPDTPVKPDAFSGLDVPWGAPKTSAPIPPPPPVPDEATRFALENDLLRDFAKAPNRAVDLPVEQVSPPEQGVLDLFREDAARVGSPGDPYRAHERNLNELFRLDQKNKTGLEPTGESLPFTDKMRAFAESSEAAAEARRLRGVEAARTRAAEANRLMREAADETWEQETLFGSPYTDYDPGRLVTDGLYNLDEPLSLGQLSMDFDQFRETELPFGQTGYRSMDEIPLRTQTEGIADRNLLAGAKQGKDQVLFREVTPKATDPRTLRLAKTEPGPGFDPGDLPPGGDVGGPQVPGGTGSPAPKPGASPQPGERGYIALRFGDHELVRSHRAYQMGRSLLRPVFYDGDRARLLAKAFKQQAHLPEGLDQILRVAENNQLTELNSRMKGVRKYYVQGLSDVQRHKIGRAIDTGTNLVDDAPQKVTDEVFQTTEDFRQHAKGIFEELWIAEQNEGLGGSYVENFVPRVDSKGRKLAKEHRQLVPTGKKLQSGKEVFRFEKSLQQLIDEGVDVNTDIAELISHRAAESARRLSRADFETEALYRFGVPKDHPQLSKESIRKLDLVDAGIVNKRLAGNYLPRRIAESMKNVNRMLNVDDEASQVARFFDGLLGEMKWMQTQANPGHHIRNFIGDVIMNMEAGMFSRRAYKKAFDVVRNIGDIEDARFLNKPVPEAVGQIRLNGKLVNAEQVWDLYKESGSKAGFVSSELKRLVQSETKNPYRRFQAATGRFGDKREDLARLAHFIGDLEKAGDSKALLNEGRWTSHAHEAAKEAGAGIRKWNIDYGALTPFERKVMRRAIPFYTFMRFNIPKQVELLFTKPGFMALYPKGNNLMQGLLDTGEADDSLVPLWIRETMPFRVQKEKQERNALVDAALGLFGVQPGQPAVGTAHGVGGITPIGDFQRLNSLFAENPLQEVSREVAGDVNPLARIPFELATGERVFNEAPIDSNLEYFAGQIPLGRLATQGGGLRSGGLARWATGIPIRGISPAQERGEFRRREDVVRAMFDVEMAKTLPPEYQMLEKEEQRKIMQQLVEMSRQTGLGI